MYVCTLEVSELRAHADRERSGCSGFLVQRFVVFVISRTTIPSRNQTGGQTAPVSVLTKNALRGT